MLAKAPRQRFPAPERRRQIAEAALEILATGGVKNLTAREIAARVGVQDGSLFRHFPTTEAMAAAAVEAFEALLSGTFPEETAEPMLALEQLFRRRVALARQRPALLRLALNDRLAEVAGADGAERVRGVVERSVSFIREQLTRAQRARLIRADVPIEVLVWMFTGVLHGTAGASHAPSSRRRAARIDPEHAWRALEQLLGAEPATKAPRPPGKKDVHAVRTRPR